ncbi:MAG TPA: histidine phosphatase family protein [Ignavibacteria bacterium]|nr:histidine phosphatase family protein [Ignavibacteria bacterium]
MKSLYLVRHAKSSWDDPGLSDLERPLNKRGKTDSPAMGKLLYKQNDIPELMISSNAKRAFSTAKRIAKELDYPVKKIIVNDKLYMADIDDFINVIHSRNEEIDKLMLFGHNYGITYFANYISDADIDNIPTCGIVRIDFDFNSWKEIENKKGKLIFFEYPKKHKI